MLHLQSLPPHPEHCRVWFCVFGRKRGPRRARRGPNEAVARRGSATAGISNGDVKRRVLLGPAERGILVRCYGDAGDGDKELTQVSEAKSQESAERTQSVRKQQGPQCCQTRQMRRKGEAVIEGAKNGFRYQADVLGGGDKEDRSVMVAKKKPFASVERLQSR